VSIQQRLIRPISALDKNFNPQNTSSIPVVKIAAKRVPFPEGIILIHFRDDAFRVEVLQVLEKI